MFVDLLLSKHKYNGAAARRFHSMLPIGARGAVWRPVFNRRACGNAPPESGSSAGAVHPGAQLRLSWCPEAALAVCLWALLQPELSSQVQCTAAGPRGLVPRWPCPGRSPTICPWECTAGFRVLGQCTAIRARSPGHGAQRQLFYVFNQPETHGQCG